MLSAGPARPPGSAGSRRQCAVVGHPVRHSLSPAIHRAAYARLGLDWDYQRHDIAPGGLPAFVTGLDASWRGLSVTMPHKEDAARLGVGDEPVALTGVANTLIFDEGVIAARNTDVAGFRIALAAHGIGQVPTAVIIGNGATARSAVAALAGLGTREVQFVVRSAERARGVVELAESLGLAATVCPPGTEPTPAALVISTVPADGVVGAAEALAAAAEVVFDSVYDPWPTPLAAAAERAGRPVLNGLDLLAGQAVDQVRWFTGRPFDFEVARSAARAGLSGD